MSEKERGLVVGLTGNIGSGKTSVLKMFSDLGCDTLSADDLSHQILDENGDIQRKVFKYFATVDRKKLAEIVFTNPKKLLLLETILHPEINKVIEERLGSLPKDAVMVIEIPLLFETGWDKRVDYVVFVSCPTETRKKRFYDYHGDSVSVGDFECRDTAQMKEAGKAGRASFVIDNSKDLKSTEAQVKKVLSQLKRRGHPFI